MYALRSKDSAQTRNVMQIANDDFWEDLFDLIECGKVLR